MQEDQLYTFIIDEFKKKKIRDVEIFNQKLNNFSAELRLSKLENIENAISKGIGIRIFKDGRTAFVSSSDFNKESLKSLIDITADNLKESDQSEYNQIPGFRKIEEKNLEVYHPKATNIEKTVKIEKAKELEELCMNNSQITNSNGSAYTEAQSYMRIVNTEGADITEKRTSYSLSVSPIASLGKEMETNYWYSIARSYDDLQSVSDIANKAIERTIRQLNAQKPDSGKYAIVFENTVSARFFSILFAGINGLSVFKKETFLHDKLKQKLFPDFVNLIEDPFIAKGIGSQNYDDEAIPSQYKEIVKDGVLKTFIHNHYSALKNKTHSTGNASRSYTSRPGISATNIYVENSSTSQAELLAKNPKTILITGIMGENINSLTGDFSMGAGGLLFENGHLKNAVKEFTIAGNLLNLFKEIDSIANDRLIDKAISAPAFLVNELSVSGT